MERIGSQFKGRVRRGLGAGLCVLLFAASAAQAVPSRHTVAPQDCLWDLAQRYYGDPWRWPGIAEANPQVSDPHWIYPGQVLAIPGLPSAEAEEPAEAPVEAASAVEAPAPVAAAAAAPAPAVSETMPAAPASSTMKEGVAESLALGTPRGQTGGYPSMTRLKAPAGWKSDGTVTDFEGQEIITAEGDLVEARLAKSVKPQVGERFYALRRDALREGDTDKKGVYLQRVGVLRAEKVVGEDRVHLRILTTGDSVQAGDLLSREAL